MTSSKLRGRPSDKAHEAVKVLDVHMRINNMSRAELARKSGVATRTLADWWYGRYPPNVFLLDCALNVFGLRLKVGAKQEG